MPLRLPVPRAGLRHQKNLRAPIEGMGLEKELSSRAHRRYKNERAGEFSQQAAHFLVTTPESLAVMLAQKAMCTSGDCRFVIVDELHSFAGNKRGVDLTLSLERLEELVCRQRTRAITLPGWSFRDRRAARLARQFLVGEDRPCRIAEARVEKKSIVEVFSPIRRNPYPPAGYTGARLYAELAELIRSRQSVLVFTNVRSAAEQIGLRLKELLPDLADASKPITPR